MSRMLSHRRSAGRLACLIAAMALLPLSSACVWVGPALHGDEHAETPVPPGRYRATVNNDPTGAVVSVAGKTMLMALGDMPSFGVQPVPLAVERRKVWIGQAATGPDGRGYAYGLIGQTGAGWAVEPYLVCADTEAIVREAGGTIEAGTGPRGTGDIGPNDRACMFDTPIALRGGATPPARRALARHDAGACSIKPERHPAPGAEAP